MKKTYAYVMYLPPKTNRHGSYASTGSGATCLGVTLNMDEKVRTYKQAEIEYPEGLYRIQTINGRRVMEEADGTAVSPNELLTKGLILVRVWGRDGKPTKDYRSLDELTGGEQVKPLPSGELPCDCCSGTGKVTAFVDYADRSRSGVQQINCSNCKGTGKMTPEHLDRREKGQAIRDDRVARGLSLREEAQRLDITPSALSRLERGELATEGEAE